jgi:hypothetical protein
MYLFTPYKYVYHGLVLTPLAVRPLVGSVAHTPVVPPPLGHTAAPAPAWGPPTS